LAQTRYGSGRDAMPLDKKALEVHVQTSNSLGGTQATHSHIRWILRGGVASAISCDRRIRGLFGTGSLGRMACMIE
jgi:hypothetical protein